MRSLPAGSRGAHTIQSPIQQNGITKDRCINAAVFYYSRYAVGSPSFFMISVAPSSAALVTTVYTAP